jgi:predicted thioesterase
MTTHGQVEGTVPGCETGPIEAGFLVAGTLEAATEHAHRHGVETSGDEAALAPHTTAPEVGSRSVTTYVVRLEDTAAAMGHPDPSMAVLGSPRIGLWFEIATSPLMPGTGQGVQHVGVGLVVHHLQPARIDEEVRVGVEVTKVTGRSVRFSCDAWCGERLIATGAHHRIIRPM